MIRNKDCTIYIFFGVSSNSDKNKITLGFLTINYQIMQIIIIFIFELKFANKTNRTHAIEVREIIKYSLTTLALPLKAFELDFKILLISMKNLSL